jgi:hypothetical protein
VNTGAQGTQGVQGATGSTGAQGVQGVTGYTGAQGVQGFSGYAGFAVWTGATGAQGTTGTINIVSQNPLSATGTSLGFTGDYNNVYYRQSTSSLNYITGFIQPAASFGLNNGYVGQTLTVQSTALASITVSGAFMDSTVSKTAIALAASGDIVSLVFNGSRWVMLYRSTGTTSS